MWVGIGGNTGCQLIKREVVHSSVIIYLDMHTTKGLTETAENEVTRVASLHVKCTERWSTYRAGEKVGDYPLIASEGNDWVEF